VFRCSSALLYAKTLSCFGTTGNNAIRFQKAHPLLQVAGNDTTTKAAFATLRRFEIAFINS